MTCWLIICFLSLTQNIAFCDELLVNSKTGPIRGNFAEDGDYHMFLGIPYAAVNKSNPFGESLPCPNYETVFEANDESVICPQLEEFNYTIVGHKDCLRLNIYVPNASTLENPLPVLVYIHGGGFDVGFSATYLYGPKYLMRYNIIFVTINYRIGPYGFLCLNTPEVPGNQGFRDQIKALKWIRNNIVEFGGNPNSITLSGHSFGATCVDLLLHSTNEVKLFDKAIIQSYSFRSTLLTHKPKNTDLLMLAEQIGHKTNSIEDALAFLATVDPKTVIEASLKLNLQYGICIENTYANVDHFLPATFSKVNKPKVENMSILIGNTDMEMLFKYNANDPNYNEKYDPFKEYIELYKYDKVTCKDMENILRQFYIGDEVISEKVKNELLMFSCDAHYLHPSKQIMNKYIEYEAKDVFYYVFSYSGNRNFLKLKLNLTDQGSAHADELGYIFDISYMSNKPTSEDQLTIDRLTTLWTNFVKYGNPTPEKTELLSVEWKPYTKGLQYYMKINTELALDSAPFHKRMAFWDLFFKVY